MSSSLNSIGYSNSNAEFKKTTLTASTKRKLESLGIDPALVSSESQALALIATRQGERSFEQYAVQQTADVSDTTQQAYSTESELISEAKALAEQLGITIDNDATFEDITASISNAIADMVHRSMNDPIALQRAQQYQTQLSQLTDQYNNVSSSNINMYSAMSFQANNTRYMLGL